MVKVGDMVRYHRSPSMELDARVEGVLETAVLRLLVLEVGSIIREDGAVQGPFDVRMCCHKGSGVDQWEPKS